MIETLRLIITRCPGVASEAARTIQAISANSPVIQQRLNHVAAAAIEQGNWTRDERAAIAALMDTTEDSAGTTLSIRCTKAELAEIDRLAGEAGHNDRTSYVRERLGLI